MLNNLTEVTELGWDEGCTGRQLVPQSCKSVLQAGAAFPSSLWTSLISTNYRRRIASLL